MKLLFTFILLIGLRQTGYAQPVPPDSVEVLPRSSDFIHKKAMWVNATPSVFYGSSQFGFGYDLSAKGSYFINNRVSLGLQVGYQSAMSKSVNTIQAKHIGVSGRIYLNRDRLAVYVDPGFFNAWFKRNYNADSTIQGSDFQFRTAFGITVKINQKFSLDLRLLDLILYHQNRDNPAFNTFGVGLNMHLNNFR